jgi:predicted membrane chloride channel (bestrophin family)
MTKFINFFKIIDRQTIAITILALISTWLCRQFDYLFEIPSGLIGIAVIFPLVFSISSAYRRREEALRYFATIKGHAAAIYLAHRDWLPNDQDMGDQAATLVQELLTAVSNNLHASETEKEQTLHKVYRTYDAISHSHEQLRQMGVTSGEVSRSNQALRSIMIEFERMRNIANYRTPVALRAYSSFFLSLFPIVFAPYFASIAYPDYLVPGYLVAILYSLILVSLDNIQESLENPYDGVGPDDLRLDIADAFAGLLTAS